MDNTKLSDKEISKPDSAKVEVLEAFTTPKLPSKQVSQLGRKPGLGLNSIGTTSNVPASLQLDPPRNIQLSSSNSSSQATKRRRVTRACDNCRQKKVKCDGKQPCIHCTVYSYSCTYDQPNIRNKRSSNIPPSGLSNTLILQQQQLIAAQQLATRSTTVYNMTVAQQLLNMLLPKLGLNLLDDNNAVHMDIDKLEKIISYVNSKSNDLKEIQELYQDGPTPKNIYIESPIGKSITSPTSLHSNDELVLGTDFRLMLPPKEDALQLIHVTWYKACVLFRFYHRPSLIDNVESIYATDPYNYTDKQQKFLPFFYSILACGSLFSKKSDADKKDNDTLEDEGFNYFLEARRLIDIANVGDISSIQTIVMIIMYLQCSARLSTCYSYIGIALRSAIKEGLHRDLSIFQNSKRKLSPIEIDTRKRLFYTIYKMDIYINSLLGLPRSIHEDEIDQDMPVELDDENVTELEFKYSEQGGRLSSSGCANHHTKLMFILDHIIKELYPIRVKNKPGNQNQFLTPNHIHKKVTDLEVELKQWLDNLPIELKPTDPLDPKTSEKIPEKFLLANYYLHLAFLNCQIMMYRPFIHFISHGQLNFEGSDPRSLIRGRNCIKVARMVVKLANKMIDEDLLVGTYWFSMYTIFFSIACLIYYFHFANYYNTQNGNGANYAGVLFDDDLNIDMIRQDIVIGKKVLDCLKGNSNASLRIYNILNTLFEQLNRRTAKNSSNIHSQNLLKEPTLIPNNIKNETVQTTFQTFDFINNFGKNQGPKTNTIDLPPSCNFDAPAIPLSTANANNISLVEGMGNSAGSTSLISGSEEADNNIRKESSKDNENYLPGVFDKLDAQIFGKILPPYMLEVNSHANALSDTPNLNSLNGLNSDMKSDAVLNETLVSDLLDPVLQSTTGNNYTPSLDMNILDDTNNMDYLDPFNPINN
ncbi:uncharacterized protein KQ657_003873 [Scheffersomyces spartinae]|uniref:Zn(2)-C6 fungal-type domain-containing protein n=1 Tax=Scheffersomyces spartinae TaxID=45513 RepID=A0A9P8AJZ3_9ASCO|nr:uncharacterized protein KQ657_003873 [Scheffersomyces spartinae]KAG7195345.1 hypothetical protein KQ657_003873 [Scheffersomyces spartinae]